jgi:hypothetical protein
VAFTRALCLDHMCLRQGGPRPRRGCVGAPVGDDHDPERIERQAARQIPERAADNRRLVVRGNENGGADHARRLRGMALRDVAASGASHTKSRITSISG